MAIYINLLLNLRNQRTVEDRIFTAGSGKTRLQEANLQILRNKECKFLGAYINEKNNKTVNVKTDLEICAARVSSKRLPERWIKVRSDPEEDDGEEKTTYEKAKEDIIKGTPRTFFYGG